LEEQGEALVAAVKVKGLLLLVVTLASALVCGQHCSNGRGARSGRGISFSAKKDGNSKTQLVYIPSVDIQSDNHSLCQPFQVGRQNQAQGRIGCCTNLYESPLMLDKKRGTIPASYAFLSIVEESTLGAIQHVETNVGRSPYCTGNADK